MDWNEMVINEPRPIVIGLGEVLWDLLPNGKQLGGAPANFAYHAQALGADAHVVSSVGDDPLGREILAQLDRLGLPCRTVSVDPAHATGTVSVTLDGQGKPTYVIHENVAWDHIRLTPESLDLAHRAKAVCFGSLAQRNEVSRATILAFLDAVGEHCLRIFDINLRQHYYNAPIVRSSLQRTDVLKLNDEELPVLADLLGIAGSEKDVVTALLETFHLRAVALTHGPKGSVLAAAGQWSQQAAAPTAVVDTVGAGDAFTAALAVGMLRQLSLETIHRHASRLAAYVCSQPGATPAVPEELTRFDAD
jgi:fructokinase